MARYGKGYYTSMDDLVVGMKSGLHEALVITCDEMLMLIRDIVEEDIYTTMKDDEVNYHRTYETLNAWTYDIDGLEAIFYLDGKEFHIVPSLGQHVQYKGANPQENYLNALKQTEWHEDVLWDIRQLLQNFPKIYRENCKKLGLELV